ncbi:hypothetical protein A0J48_019410 [Sphaerospermopsis aphanizomenoides BCCUSP55]|uniref:hypothetical protein n=1 Tax=Sphaerospermopsis aphanizomenoides TaxID=459663 RepID=UPI000AA203AB|nr:hypothetical protein [Sphaerospermopsis aphanizomenoides]MBK1989675.1 hypothetical protein [Sphaerospermopsis aphanizomenoides BCCUSP55]
MKKIVNRLQSKILRQILIISLLVLTLFSIQSWNDSKFMLIAQADTVKTPEGIYYKGTPDPRKIRNDQQRENTQERLKETTENVRRKLNLDEPIPDATKEFLEDVQTNIEKSVNPITGNTRGYYQDNSLESSVRNNR